MSGVTLGVFQPGVSANSAAIFCRSMFLPNENLPGVVEFHASRCQFGEKNDGFVVNFPQLTQGRDSFCQVTEAGYSCRKTSQNVAFLRKYKVYSRLFQCGTAFLGFQAHWRWDPGSLPEKKSTLGRSVRRKPSGGNWDHSVFRRLLTVRNIPATPSTRI